MKNTDKKEQQTGGGDAPRETWQDAYYHARDLGYSKTMAKQYAEQQTGGGNAPRVKVIFEHDTDPDFSWLEQDMYNPQSPEYSPVYRTKEDMDAGKSPMDGDWYRNPENHVSLSMLVYKMDEGDEDWQLVDSLGNIDFLADSDDWATGTFYHISALPEGYLRDLAKDAGLKQ